MPVSRSIGDCICLFSLAGDVPHVGSAGAVHQLFARLDAVELRSQLLLGSGRPAYCGACLHRRHGRTPFGSSVVCRHRLAGDVPDVGGARAVHRCGAGLDGLELRTELLLPARGGTLFRRPYYKYSVRSSDAAVLPARTSERPASLQRLRVSGIVSPIRSAPA